MEPYEWEVWKYKKDKEDFNITISGVLALVYFILFMAVILGYVKIRNKKNEEESRFRSRDNEKTQTQQGIGEGHPGFSRP